MIGKHDNTLHEQPEMLIMNSAILTVDELEERLELATLATSSINWGGCTGNCCIGNVCTLDIGKPVNNC